MWNGEGVEGSFAFCGGTSADARYGFGWRDGVGMEAVGVAYDLCLSPLNRSQWIHVHQTTKTTDLAMEHFADNTGTS